MIKIALFILLLSPFISLAQNDNIISSKFGDVNVDVYIKNRGETFIVFNEIAERLTNDTTRRDSGSVYITRMGQTVVDDLETKGKIIFGHGDFKENRSFIMFSNLFPDTEYYFKLIISINGITVTRKFNVKTSN